jgi:uncharacterized protein
MMDPIRYHSTNELTQLVRQDEKGFKLLITRLKKMKQPAVNKLIHPLHEEAFNRFSCLDCANCCSSISPIVSEKDIDRLAKYFKIKPSAFIDRYLHIDEDNDYVFNSAPCPFLLSDHFCMVYENRPKACREYPHTDHRDMQQILKLTLKNCEICPVVYSIFNEIRKTTSK